MIAVRTEWAVATSRGVTIITFAEEQLARAWWQANHHRFPGAKLEEITVTTTTTRRPVRRLGDLRKVQG